jgi:hypothetical protein
MNKYTPTGRRPGRPTKATMLDLLSVKPDNQPISAWLKAAQATFHISPGTFYSIRAKNTSPDYQI